MFKVPSGEIAVVEAQLRDVSLKKEKNQKEHDPLLCCFLP